MAVTCGATRAIQNPAYRPTGTLLPFECFSSRIEIDVFGPAIFAQTISHERRVDPFGNVWQYHSRSDHHSKVACALIMLELLRRSPILREHAANGKIAFGINHEMREFRSNRKKNLDLVICTPAALPSKHQTLLDQVRDWRVNLEGAAKREAQILPRLQRAEVATVLVALEAKACMTAHQKALPRLYDELNSSHAAVHGASDQAIAAGFVCVNASREYLSPDRNKRSIGDAPSWSSHPQPKSVSIVIDKVRQIPRRLRTGDDGFDALGIVVVDFKNDGSPVKLIETPPAPSPSDVDHFDRMIERICSIYSARFSQL